MSPVRRSGRWLRIDELPAADPADAVVAGLLLPGSVAMLWGPPNCGKSVLAHDLAVCIASGAPWAGRATRRGAVVLLNYEGGRGLRARLEAAAAARGLSAADLGSL